MAYAITRFGDTLLPTRMTVDDLDTGKVPDPITNSVSGGFDWQGRRRDYPVKQTITAQGVVVGEDTVLSTGSGLTLVDNRGYALESPSGAVLVSATDAILTTNDGFDLEVGDKINRLKAQVDELRSMLGREDRLWRRSDDRPSLEEWVNARCVSIDMPRGLAAVHSNSLRVSAQFTLAGGLWHGQEYTESVDLAPNSTAVATLTNGGNTLSLGARITVRPTSTIGRIRFVSDENHFEYSGGLVAGDVLVIDTALQSVQLNGRNAYKGFDIGDGHLTSGWMPIGDERVNVGILADGSATVEFLWHDSWV